MLVTKLPAELLQHVASYVPAYHIKAAAPTCKALSVAARNALNERPMLAVTSTTANSVVLLDIDGSRIKRWNAMPPDRIKTRFELERSWVTGIACGEDMSLHVGQYSAHGLLTFALPPDVPRAARARSAYSYEQTIRTTPSPEGIVCAHGFVYSVGVTQGHGSSLWRNTPAGTLEEKPSLLVGTLWGISLMPEKKGLFIAAHDDDDQEVEGPTIEDSGRILAVRFSDEPAGSFKHGPERIPTALRDWDAAGLQMPPLNRPTDLACCGHGSLFVASFRGYAFDRERVIYKIALSEDRTMGGEVCCITLPDGYMACGLTCMRGDVLYATAHDGKIGSSDSAIFSFPCGCNHAGEHPQGTVPQATKLTDVPGAHGIASVSELRVVCL